MKFKSTTAVSFISAFLITILSIGFSTPNPVGAQGEAPKALKVRESFAAKPKKEVREATTIEIEADTEFPAYSNAEMIVRTNAKFTKVKVQKSLFEVVKAYEVVHGKQDERRYVFTGPPGKYAVTVTTFDPDGGIGEESTTITLGKPTPEPQPDPEPDPDPQPDPDPTPDPDVITPSPIRLLFIEETDERNKLTPVQYSILFGSGTGSVRQFLKDKSAKNSAGHPEWRLLDDDLSEEHLKYEGQNFQEIYKKKTWKETPWFILSNEKGNGIEGPLDFKSVEEFKALLQKYSG
jgi:hypothetical protein